MGTYRIIGLMMFLLININLEASDTRKMEIEDILKITGPWSIQVELGEFRFEGRTISISQPVILTVAQPEIKAVHNEKHQLPLFNESKDCGDWLRGSPLTSLATQECTATDLLIPGSVKVKLAAKSSTYLVENKDYKVNTKWAVVGRLAGSAIQENQTVFIDYDFGFCRLDSIVADKNGKIRLIKGDSGVLCVKPTTIGKEETVLANIWVPGRAKQLTEENLFPVQPDRSVKSYDKNAIAEKLFPKTLKKLRDGEPITILAWGDSVTNGSYLNDPEHSKYQFLFVKKLRQRFQKSKITLLTVDWPAHNSESFLLAPPESEHNFDHRCLEPRPDLVTIEFVNDVGYSYETFQKYYNLILDKFRKNGTEIILITPHFTRPDWMGLTTLKVGTDPRPYVKYLKEISKVHKIALADASWYWSQLWRKGIPYTTLLMNSINHPDERGHEIYAQALIDLFPEK